MHPPNIIVGKKFGPAIKNFPCSIENDVVIWVDCDFKSTGLSGAHLASHIFTRCHFEKGDFYWCHAYNATFIDCKFVNCDLRGSFHGVRFIRCGFVHCQVGDNELGGKTKWENAVTVECVVAGDPLPIIEVPDELLD